MNVKKLTAAQLAVIGDGLTGADGSTAAVSVIADRIGIARQTLTRKLLDDGFLFDCTAHVPTARLEAIAANTYCLPSAFDYHAVEYAKRALAIRAAGGAKEERRAKQEKRQAAAEAKKAAKAEERHREKLRRIIAEVRADENRRLLWTEREAIQKAGLEEELYAAYEARWQK